MKLSICLIAVTLSVIANMYDAQATDDPQTARLERRVLKLCASLLALETVLGLHPAARARLGLAPQAAAADTTGLRLVRLLPHRSDTN